MPLLVGRALGGDLVSYRLNPIPSLFEDSGYGRAFGGAPRAFASEREWASVVFHGGLVPLSPLPPAPSSLASSANVTE